MKCTRCGGPLGGRWGTRCYQCHPGGLPRTSEPRACETCGRLFTRQPNELARGEGRFCSRPCKHKAMAGVEKVSGTSYVRPDGYRAVKVGIRRYQLEHRLVVEAAIRRPLREDEEVHHRNGDKLDNRLENLEVLSPTAHQERHADRLIFRRSRVDLVCRRCGARYERTTSRARSSLFCSNACRLAALHEGNRKPTP